MCGRYTLGVGMEELVEAFDVPELNFDYRPRYNIAPGQEAPVVAVDRRGRRIGLLTWGLIPSWMDEAGPGFINARAESVLDKPSFSEAFYRRRCLVPADGFYEWKKVGAVKAPYWLRPAEHGVMSFAGIWERWERSGEDPKYTFAILTTDANQDVRPIHDRMPVVIQPEQRALWLDRETAQVELEALLGRTPPEGSFASHEVSRRVNRPGEDDPALVDPVDRARG